MAEALTTDELGHVLAGAGTGVLSPELLAELNGLRGATQFDSADRHTYVLSQGWTPPALGDQGLSGRLAACDALSLIYAQGARPVLAVPLLGQPEAAATLRGLSELCGEIGLPLGRPTGLPGEAGACGLAVLGQAMPQHVKGPSQARAGDGLIIGRPLGSGIYRAAARDSQLHPADLAAWQAEAGRPDTPGPMLACLDGVHAMLPLRQDGLLGQVLNLCRVSGLGAELRLTDLPLLPRLRELAAAQLLARRQVPAALPGVVFAPAIEPAVQAMLQAPHVGGGLLLSCALDTVTEVLSIFLQQGFEHVSVIGRLCSGPATIKVV